MIKIIQQLTQGIFLRLEKGLNAIFGPALNPLYYLGGITYLMFWIISVSGFYIYFFYDTGVDDAFSSIEELTHTQWYLGGLLRSMHRYASDGMVLAAGLHLLRSFAFDRYRNFRWFSWYTGVLLIWLVYICGINGYWLVWDKLAQFVAVATSEWLDVLPIFSAPLARNFLEQGSVNDRFFSLLSLIHLGVPLALFGIIWIHTQRVPQAKTSPPKHLRNGLILSMLVLSLIKPALSQGHADLDASLSTLNLDWFYLWVFPLLYSWGAEKLWFLAAGVTGLFLLLPWLRWGGRGKGEFEISSVPCGHVVMAKKGETILEAALRQEVNLPYVCRDGACGVCKGTILKGTIDYGVYQKGTLTDAEKAEGKALFCCAKPLSDLTIECHEVDDLNRFPVYKLEFRVQKMTRVAQDVMVLELRHQGDDRINFIAGQYVAVQLDDGTKRSYSIANPPHETDHLELHIRLVQGGKFTGHVFNGGMKESDMLQVEGPYGSFFLHDDSDKPIIFMAGNTGFAPIKSMVEHAFKVGLKRQMALYWGVKTPADFYLTDLAEKWQQEHDNFKFIPVLSEPKPEYNWQGRTGMVTDAILEDYPELNNYQIYACGPPAMVEAGRIPFMERGLPEKEYFSDAFFVSHHNAPAAEALVSSKEVKHD